MIGRPVTLRLRTQSSLCGFPTSPTVNRESTMNRSWSILANPLTCPVRRSSKLSPPTPDGKLTVLTEDFYSVEEPEISYDGRKILFAGQKTADDGCEVWEMNIDGSELRQITTRHGRCLLPLLPARRTHRVLVHASCGDDARTHAATNMIATTRDWHIAATPMVQMSSRSASISAPILNSSSCATGGCCSKAGSTMACVITRRVHPPSLR